VREGQIRRRACSPLGCRKRARRRTLRPADADREHQHGEPLVGLEVAAEVADEEEGGEQRLRLRPQLVRRRRHVAQRHVEEQVLQAVAERRHRHRQRVAPVDEDLLPDGARHRARPALVARDQREARRQLEQLRHQHGGPAQVEHSAVRSRRPRGARQHGGQRVLDDEQREHGPFEQAAGIGLAPGRRWLSRLGAVYSRVPAAGRVSASRQAGCRDRQWVKWRRERRRVVRDAWAQRCVWQQRRR